MNSDFIEITSSYSKSISLLQKRTRISSEKLLYKLGEIFGDNLAQEISATELKEIVKETFSIWQQEGLGQGAIEQENPLTITIKDCHGCNQIPNKNEIIDCKFKEGMLTAILTHKLGTKNEVKHISSFGKIVGKKRCWFVVIDTKNN